MTPCGLKPRFQESNDQSFTIPTRGSLRESSVQAAIASWAEICGLRSKAVLFQMELGKEWQLPQNVANGINACSDMSTVRGAALPQQDLPTGFIALS